MPPKVKTGASKQDGESTDANVIRMTIVDGEKRYSLASDEIGPTDDLACRQQTGFPPEHFFEYPSGTTVLVVIWLARRKSGEPNLAFQKVMSKYPTYASMDKLELKYDGMDEEDESPLAEDD